jgi:hypothetical protein
MPPPLRASIASRVHKITDSVVGSPDATPRVNGSPDSVTCGTGLVVGAEVVDASGCVSADFSSFEQATTTTEAPRARNIRREIGEVIGGVLQILSRSCATAVFGQVDFMTSSFDL